LVYEILSDLSGFRKPNNRPFDKLTGFVNIGIEARKGVFKTKNMAMKITTFFKEVNMEVRKVNWPPRQQILNYTMIVLGISAAVALFLGGLDFVFTTIINKFVL